MPRNDEERQAEAYEYEYASDGEDQNPLNPASGSTVTSTTTTGPSGGNPGSRAFASRSHYHLPPGERLRGVANRIIFSRYYVLFYFVMMCLSLGTVGLSLVATRESGYGSCSK